MAFYDFLPDTEKGPVYQSTDALLHRWETWLLSKAFSPKTIQTYLYWGRRMATRYPALSQSTFSECVQQASASLRRQLYSASTIHQFQCVMASLAESSWMWDEERRKALITARPVKIAYAVPNENEIREFVTALAAPHRLVALLCYCCGLRISECVSLTLGDINLTSRMLTVRQSKGAKGRQVPIPPELVPLIQARADLAIKVCQADLKAANVVAPLTGLEYRLRPGSSREPGQWPLFFQNSLVWDHRVSLFVRVFLHESRVEKAFKECRSKSGVITRITPHRLRDAYAIHSLLAGVPINVIQQHMGHATVETTAKYLSFLLTPEGAKLFPGFDLFKNLTKTD